MKNRLLAAVILVFVLGLLVYFWRPAGPPQNPAAGPDKASQDAAVAAALAKQNPATVALIASNFARIQPVPADLSSATAAVLVVRSGPPSPLEYTDIPPAVVVANVRHAVRQYGGMFGGDPVGTNPEITAALAGKNPRHINFINADAGMRVNENGEMVDPWGTPLFFHQISGTEMEIHSAGPDRIMWTGDDIVAR